MVFLDTSAGHGGGEDFGETFAVIDEGAEIENPRRRAFAQRLRCERARLPRRKRVLEFIEGEQHAHPASVPLLHDG